MNIKRFFIDMLRPKPLKIKYVVGTSVGDGVSDTKVFVTPWGNTILIAEYGGYTFDERSVCSNSSDNKPKMFNTQGRALDFRPCGTFWTYYEVEVDSKGKIVNWLRKI